MEQKITEQDAIIESMRQGMDVAAVEQASFLHNFNKAMRQHAVDKHDAEENATKARDDLALFKRKTATRIKNLERDVQIKAQDQKDIQSTLDAQLCSMKEAERDLAKERRQLGVKWDDLKKQQAVSEFEVTSLAFVRANNKSERKKLKTSHSKALQFEQETSEQDKKVTF